jgi:hypothetical protein
MKAGFSMAGPWGKLPKLNVSKLMCGAAASAKRTCCGSMLSTSPKATGKLRRAFVDTAFAFDKVPQWLVQVLVFRGIPHHPRPFAPRPVIDLVTISRTINDGPERFGCLTLEYPRRRNARLARLTALPSCAHHETSSKTAVR